MSSQGPFDDYEEEAPDQADSPVLAPAAGPPLGSPPLGSADEAEPQTEFDEFLNRAVDRQIAEQRALRETLSELSEAVRELQDRPVAEIDVDAIDERIREGMESNARTVAKTLRDLRDELRDEMTPGIERSDLKVLRDAIGNVSGDIEGIAQALIELNSGLREWAQSVDRNIRAVRETVGQVREVTTQSKEEHSEVLADVLEVMRRSAEEQAADREKATDEHTIEERAELIEQRVKETTELSVYLADQIEGFDDAIGRMSELPTKLEGVVAQALKRTLTARAKLDREAEKALDDVLASLDEQVDNMAEAIAQVGDSGPTLHAVSEGQDDLGARLESLQTTLLNALSNLPVDDLPPARSARPSVRGAPARRTEIPKSQAKRSRARSAKPKASAKRAKPPAARRRKAEPTFLPIDDEDATE